MGTVLNAHNNIGGRYNAWEIPGRGVLISAGTAKPTDGTPGYAPGCLFFDTDAAAGLQWYVNIGSRTSCNFDLTTNGIDLSTLTATAAELNRLDDDLAVVATAAGTAWASAEYIKTSVIKIGDLYHTTIALDLTGLDAIATDGDIIGKSTSPASLCRLTAARNGGTIASMRVTCEEAPAGASADIDIFRATVATGKLDDAMSGITGQAVAITAGGSWTNGAVKCATAVPVADDYLYFANGAGANAGTYTAGKFRIEILGY